MCLRRQCSEYVQSRVFEAMLEFQVTNGNIPGAAETIKCAKSLDIRITADYLQMYLTAKKEFDQNKESSYIFKLKSIFTRK